MKTLFLCLSLLLSGCGGVLKPVKDTSVTHVLDPTVAERRLTSSAPAVAISRPSLPSYLDRQQLVNRSGKDGQLEMNSFHLWAEPLDAAVSRVTSANLSRLTGSLNIQPVENFVTLDYTSLIEIRISKFEADPSGQVILECTWKLQPVRGAIAATRPFKTSVFVQPGVSVESARVAAMNEALARLAREIGRSL